MRRTVLILVAAMLMFSLSVGCSKKKQTGQKVDANSTKVDANSAKKVDANAAMLDRAVQKTVAANAAERRAQGQ
jgi:hypothetical protein